MNKNNARSLRISAHFQRGGLLSVMACLLLGTAAGSASAEPSMSSAGVAGMASTKAPGYRDALESLLIKGQPKLKSSSVLVLDEAGSSVLYSKRADVPLPVASITKLMTALVVLEAEQPMDELIEITEEDRDLEKGSTSRLPFGTELTRDELLHLALMASENRAAHAMGRNYPGGLAAFVKAMNSKARALGMSSASFVDPTGLSSLNVSSAADLAKLVSAAANNPIIREYSTYQSYAVMIGRKLVEFHTTNSLVALPDWEIAVQKTGFTNDAGRCLVMKAVIQDRPVLMVLLHSSGKNTRVADARRVKQWVETGKPVRSASLDTRTL